MLFVLSTGAGSFEGALSPDVDCVGLGMADVAEDAAKKTVREAGPSWSAEREMVIGMTGLWYFRRGR